MIILNRNKLFKFLKLLLYLLPILLAPIKDYWISHNKDKQDFFINFLETSIFDIKFIHLLFLILIICLLYNDISNYLKQKEEKREKQNEKEIKLIKEPLIKENDELKRKLDTKAGSLIDSFSQLQHFQEKEVLMKHLKEFTDNKDRIYITRCFKMNNTKCVMCLSLIPSMIEYGNLYDLLTTELMNHLDSDFNLCYNYNINDDFN